jgi:hypothetical protein
MATVVPAGTAEFVESRPGSTVNARMTNTRFTAVILNS